MERVRARDLVKLEMPVLWEILKGRFILEFDDGEIETNWRATLYSAYGWAFHREFPETPLLRCHHVDSVMGDTRLNSKTHLELLGNSMFSTYDRYVELGQPVSMDYLTRRVYQLTNEMYNELTYKLEEYVTSIDIVDFHAILKNREVAHANATVTEDQESIDTTYRAIHHALETDPTLIRNPVALAVRSKIVDKNQVNQCVGPLGIRTDIDSMMFKKPILTGYARGIRSFHDSLIESRSAAKSLSFSKTPLQDAEYFSRRLQLMCQIVQNLHHTDCGSTNYMLWQVQGPKTDHRGVQISNGDLGLIQGKWYMDDDGKLKLVRKGDKHLIGRTLKLRTVLDCAHEDPYGVCSTCFGELSLSVPDRTNLGHMCGTSMTQKSSQSVLSVKHLDGSAAIDPVVLDSFEAQYLKVAGDDNSYLFGERIRGKNVKMVISCDEAPNITDVTRAQSVEQLIITRISELSSIKVIIDKGDLIDDVEIGVAVGRRLGSLTYPMLKHIREKGWTNDAKGNYVIDLEGYDHSQPFLSLPLKHINMSDHSKDIAAMLESSVSQMYERDKLVSPHALCGEIYAHVNSKLSVNLAVLEVVLLGAMIRSADDRDYGLPKPWTQRGVGVMSLSMANRSMAAAMAFEDHRDLLVNPMSYVLHNRPDHPMDGILMPQILNPDFDWRQQQL